MKPHLTWMCCGLMVLSGCSCWDTTVRSQSPDDAEPDGPRTLLVGELAVPYGMFPTKVEAVGLVTGLKGTGSDPAPSPQRAALLEEMKTRGVDKPNAVLASTDTALVLIRGVLRPGIQKGDRFDVELRIPSQSETTSLRGGYLLETRLKELAVLNQQIHEGHTLAAAQGPVMVDPAAGRKEDRVLLGRGRVLGGAVALKPRQLGLVLKPNHQSVLKNVRNSARIEKAVNGRFHSFRNGVKIGVASAQNDKFVELTVHPDYKNNISRYLQLVRSVALRETAAQRSQRVAELKRRLLDPESSAEVALQLEALGSDGVDALLGGIKASDQEVRFYSAEALAYLGRREAAEPLGEAARELPAFRVFALNALSAMEDFAAYEQLRELLTVASAETRYGAFRAMWAMNPGDALVMGERLGGQFSYHVLDSIGPPMIHVTRSRRPEVVIFGQDQRFLTPLAVNAGNDVMVTSSKPEEIAVSKYTVGRSEKRTVSTRVDDVIRAIAELGGTYPDVVQALQEAKAAGALTGRLEVDALPEAGRQYYRSAKKAKPESDPAAMPRRGLFSRVLPKWITGDKSGSGSAATEHEETTQIDSVSARQPHSSKGFLARMMGNGSK